MMNILLVDSKEATIKAVTEGLQSELCASVTVCRSAQEAVKHLKAFTSDLIISRNCMEVDGEDEDTARTVLNVLYDQEVITKAIVLGDLEISGIEFEKMPDRFRVSDLIKCIIKMFHISKEELTEIRLPDFVPIPLNHFYLMTTVPCDIYIRIEKKGAEDSHIKRIHCGDTFDKAAIRKYEENKVLSFYVEKDMRHVFLNSLVNQSLKCLDCSESVDEVLEKISDSYQITRELILSTGVDANTFQLVDGTLNAMTKVIDDNPVMSVLLSALLRSQGSLGYRHAHLIILFANKLLCNLEWVAEAQCQSMLDRVAFVSYFHDFFLVDDKLQDISSKAELESRKLSDQERDLVLNHANLAATLAQKISKAPSGVDIIIREHHGAPNGVGFVDRYGVNISKQAIAFIVLEDFTWRLLKFQKGVDSMPKIFDEMNEKFHQRTYQEVIEGLKKAVSSANS